MQKDGRGSTPTAADLLHPFVFGDRPMDEWPATDGDDQGETWEWFVRARSSFAAGDVTAARRLWQQIARREDGESRHILQAWRFLRESGVAPSESVSRQVFGGVVEVPVQSAHDLLAVYADGSARYLNYSGSAVVAEPGATGSLAQAAGAFLDATGLVAHVAGPWDDSALPPLPPGHSRVTALTPGGIRFGQGPDEALRHQRPAADMLIAALPLLTQIVANAV